MQKIKEKLILRESGASHYPKDERMFGYWCFEYRDSEGQDYSIEDHVSVNNIGSLMSNRDILQDAVDVGLYKEREYVMASDLEKIYENIVYVSSDKSSGVIAWAFLFFIFKNQKETLNEKQIFNTFYYYYIIHDINKTDIFCSNRH